MCILFDINHMAVDSNYSSTRIYKTIYIVRYFKCKRDD